MPIPVPGRVAETLRRCTVQIYVGRGRQRGNGSGAVIAPEQVITNAHVVRGPITVESWEGKSFSASVLKIDSRRDLALLAAPGLNAPLVSLGDSSALKPGTPVVAIGNPLGFVGAVSSGIVHSVGRLRSNATNGLDWILADLQLAPGNSGGPLADFQGQVVGINTMIAAGGLAFAVPSRAVQRFFKASPKQLSLGVVIRSVELPAKGPGMLVLELTPGGAAEAASLLPGDILISANGIRLRDPEDLMTAIEDVADGLLRLEFSRGRTRYAAIRGRPNATDAGAKRCLIRVGILADTLAGERRLAELLAEDARLEIVEMDVLASSTEDHSGFADVIVTAGLALDQMPGAVPVIALTELDTPAWSQNVHAWLPLNATAAEIFAAVLAASCDLTVLTKPQARRWLGSTGVIREAPNQMIEMLTARELEVLRMLADGLSNKEVAARLGISDHTAKFHVTQILGKLGATSRTEAAAIGIRRGLIPI